ncbi:hypothetical protein [Terracoccus sp. 273MFTsu3.1]|uniref:hypothetical protein n=1 Tax=Terracoccus sp. 273MFTsu3.1 TaxID=1172188 RepID=UPI00037A7339|nr:hypothetical protein [Terracoccus sp. 273MFTsu3.1]
MSTTENPYAGQGPVLLDIGDDVGALVVAMPAATDGVEVEIRPAGSTERGGAASHHHPHVAVVGRPNGGSIAYTLIYPSVTAGDYELAPLPVGEVVMSVTVRGGQVTRATWPDEAVPP